MEQMALDMGFTFVRTGCPCVGRPRIYTANRNGHHYELSLFIQRGGWRMKMDGYSVESGNESNLQSKIQSLWA